MKGFYRIAGGVPELHLGDPAWNAREILRLYRNAEKEGAALFAVPELSLTGYSCSDLFEQELLIDAAMVELQSLAAQTHSTVLICGVPCQLGHALFNTAAILQNGRIRGFAAKEFLPDSGVFYEKRQFAPAHELSSQVVKLHKEEIPIGSNLIFDIDGVFKFGVEICEDLWAVHPPSSDMALNGAEVIINLSASNAEAGKAKYRDELVRSTSSKLTAAYFYVGAGIGESTSDLVFDGQAICAINGEIAARSKRFQKESQIVYCDFKPRNLRHIRRKNTSFRSSRSPAQARLIPLDNFEGCICPEYGLIREQPFIPADQSEREEYFNEILDILASGLARRMEYTGSQTMVIGVSGGLDSALALLICARCADRLQFSRKSVVGITMPGLGTGSISQNAAVSLMDALGVTQRNIAIGEEVAIHLNEIGHAGAHDITFENAQARERTKILMDLANSLHGIVIGTGDLSELALGWCTYNADQMAMYCVNASLPKTLVKGIVEYLAKYSDAKLKETLLEIIRQPYSPELIPGAPPTEAQIGSYELHDFFLWHFLTYGETPDELLKLAEHAFSGRFSKTECKNTLAVFLKRFLTQQFKRNPMPDGPKATALSLSPRGDWRMPSDVFPGLWISNLQNED